MNDQNAILALALSLFLVLALGACGNNDGGSSNNDDSITTNSTPVANAGADQNVTTGSTVTLDGSGSSDADRDALSYAWTFTSRPGGSAAVLSDSTYETPTFVPDVEGSYVLSLTVSDGLVNSMSDTVTITATIFKCENYTDYVYCNDFENSTVGIYDESALSAEWNDPQHSVNGFSGDSNPYRVSIEQSSGNKFMNVFYPSGSCGPKDSDNCGKGGGAQWLMKLDSAYEYLYFSYRVKFNDGFDFVRGGKLPGFVSAPLNDLITGGDTATGCNGWSARIMWHGSGDMSQYLYIPGYI